MSDINTAPAGASASSSNVVQIPITKSNGETVAVDFGLLHDEHYKACLISGAKAMINGGTTKIVKPADTSDEAEMAKFYAAGVAKAKERLQGMIDGTLTIRGRVQGTHTKASGDHPAGVVTEARRVSRGMVKAAMKEKGIKVTRVPSAEITKAANGLLNDPEIGPTLYAQAEKNLAEQGKLKVGGDILSALLPKEDPKLIAKEQAAKQAKAGTLSAKQAGMPASATAH